ncbi:MAG TPA: hypothetical protein VFV68_14645 [Agriterribacter sp.]|nr:hypothetical protein [Agriterribacter sp.]
MSKFIFHILIVSVLFASCSKEYSQERMTGVNPPLGNDCSMTTVTPFDSASGRGFGSFHVTFGADDRTQKVELYDSASGTVDYYATFTYINDTIRISANEFFVLDASRRISEYHTLENPSDSNSEHYKYTYEYAPSGQLYHKYWFLASRNPDEPLFAYNYEWVNDNLVRVEAREAGGDKRIVLQAELSYAIDKTVKNYLYCFPEADELAPYILSVNVGKKSRNLLQKIVVKLYDAGGNELDTYNTEYKDYKFSSDDYITEVYASGDIVDGLPIVTGLTKFSYYCK